MSALRLCPSELKEKVLALLGPENTYEVSLSEAQLNSFDRHIVHKISDLETAFPLIAKALAENKRVFAGGESGATRTRTLSAHDDNVLSC